MRSIPISWRTSSLVLLLWFAFSIVCRAEDKRVVVARFSASQTLGGIRPDAFTNDLAAHLRKSRATPMTVETDTGRIADSAFLGDHRALDGTLHRLWKEHKKFEYRLLGRISDDSSDIVFVDVQLYRNEGDSTRDSSAFVASLHAEGTEVEAFRNQTLLSEWLITQLVSQIESNLDDRIRVLLTPFVFHGSDPRFKDFGGMISAILGSQLNVSERIRVIVRDSMYEPRGLLRSYRAGETREWTLPELGKLEAAKYVISGNFYATDNSIGIEATYIDVESGRAALSKAVQQDAATGRRVFEQIEDLGKSLRNAIELDYDVKNSDKKLTVAVVPLTPLPPTVPNKELTNDIVGSIARNISSLAPSLDGKQLSVKSSGQYFQGPGSSDPDPAVVCSQLNVQYLWMVRLERLATSYNVTFQLFDTKRPNEMPVLETFPCDRTSMDSALIARFDTVFRSLLVRSGDRSYDTDKNAISKFVEDSRRHPDGDSNAAQPVSRRRSIAVVPAPPFPSELGLKLITSNVIQVVDAELKSLQMQSHAFDLVPAEQLFDDFVSSRGVDYDSLGLALNAEYLWITSVRKFGHVRYVNLELRNTQNPLEKKIVRSFPIGHIDHLVGNVVETTAVMLTEWSPALDALVSQTGPSIRSSFKAETAGIRLRIGLAGFLDSYKHIFSDDLYRQSVEATGIIYLMPWQIEFSWMFDVGKSSAGKSLLGRYYSAELRHSWTASFISEDSRIFLGVGAAFMKVRVDSAEANSNFISWDAVVTAGMEIPFSPYLYWDLSATGWLAPGDIRAASSLGPQTGRLSLISIGVGLGYRFY